jgi:hypothetical protein
MPTFEQIQEKVRSRFPQAPTIRTLEWQRISERVLRADDYEIHRSGVLGNFTYELFKLPFHQKLHGPCESAQEAMEAASLHQVLL